MRNLGNRQNKMIQIRRPGPLRGPFTVHGSRFTAVPPDRTRTGRLPVTRNQKPETRN